MRARTPAAENMGKRRDKKVRHTGTGAGARGAEGESKSIAATSAYSTPLSRGWRQIGATPLERGRLTGRVSGKMDNLRRPYGRSSSHPTPHGAGASPKRQPYPTHE